MSVRLELFGSPKLYQQGEVEFLRLNTPTLLLCFLAAKQTWVSRSELAFLLMPDASEAESLKYLRLQLFRARKYSWAKSLEVEAMQVRWSVPTDKQIFEAAIQEERWQEAASFKGTSFLLDFGFKQPTYAAWVELERQQLELSYKLALRKYMEELESKQNFEQAALVAYKYWDLDSFDEAALQWYLRHLVLSNQKDLASQTYDAFAKLLKHELGTEPRPETQAVLSNSALTPIMLNLPSHNLSPDSTPFLGRQLELRELDKDFGESTCRLITLIGLGGSGKSRLAIAFARRQIGYFPDGVHLFELSSLNNPDSIIFKMAEVLGLPLSSHTNPKVQVLEFLKDKKALLIFDNFEHLLVAVNLLNEILTGSSKVKILVTSRERLNLKTEQLFDVEGLTYPHTVSREVALNPEAYDAIGLFLSAARRLDPRFEPDQEELEHIATICRQLSGLPLAIELAASWIRLMPSSRISRELEKGFGLLETELADIPERQRNVRAILAKTWDNLSEKKREVLANFTVFVGGCTLDAAEAVTHAPLPLLLSLVNQSLLKRIAPDRFEMHELVKQYAREKLTNSHVIEAQHSAYFESLAQRGGKELCVGKNHRWQKVFLTDYSNFTAALERNFANLKAQSNLTFCASLWFFWYSNGRFQEGIDYCEKALSLADKGNEEKAETLIGLGVLKERLNSQVGRVYLEQGLALSQDLNFEYGEQNALLYLGNLNIRQGDLGAAKSNLLRALELRQKLGYGTQQITHNLGNISYAQGKFQDAQQYYQRALDLSEENNNAYEIAIAKGSVANVSMKLGDFQKAEQLLLESKDLYQYSNDKAHLAYTELTLGVVAYHQGKHGRAKNYYETAERLSKELGWTILLTNCYLYYAFLDFYENDYEHSLNELGRCLNLCEQNSFKRETLWAQTLRMSVYTAIARYPEALEAARVAFELATNLEAPDDFRLFLDHLLSLYETFDLTKAVSLYSCAEALKAELKVVRPVAEQNRIGEFEVRAREGLGAAAFERVFINAQKLSSGEQLELAKNFLLQAN